MVYDNLDAQSNFPPERPNGLFPGRPQLTFSPCRRSFSIKVLRLKNLQFETRINSAEKSMTFNSPNRPSNPNFFRTTGKFSSINVTLDYCHLVEGCSVNNLLLSDLSNRNIVTKSSQKCIYV